MYYPKTLNMNLRTRQSCRPLAARQPPTWAVTWLPTHAEHVRRGRVQSSPALDHACSPLPWPVVRSRRRRRAPSTRPLLGDLCLLLPLLQVSPSLCPQALHGDQKPRGPSRPFLVHVKDPCSPSPQDCKAQQFSLSWPIDSIQLQWKSKHTQKVVVLVYTSNE